MAIQIDQADLALDAVGWTLDGAEITYTIDPSRILSFVGHASDSSFAGKPVTDYTFAGHAPGLAFAGVASLQGASGS